LGILESFWDVEIIIKNEDFAEYVIFQRGLQAGVFWGAL
jgi:hypothetical protein